MKKDKWIKTRGINGEYGYLNLSTNQFRTTLPNSKEEKRQRQIEDNKLILKAQSTNEAKFKRFESKRRNHSDETIKKQIKTPIMTVDTDGNFRNNYVKQLAPGESSVGGADPVGSFIVANIALNPIFKATNNITKQWLAKFRDTSSKVAYSNPSQYEIDYNKRFLISPEEFYTNDVYPRSSIKYNNPVRQPLTDYSYTYSSELPKNTEGAFYKNSGIIKIKSGLPPLKDASVKVHEFRHKLDNQYKLNIPQNQLLQNYKSYNGIIPGSDLIEEKMATNTQLRYLLANEYAEKFGKKPTIYNLDRYIEQMGERELLTKLARTNGYGSDYTYTFMNFIKPLSDKKRYEAISSKVQNIKKALKYVPTVGGFSMTENKKGK